MRFSPEPMPLHKLLWRAFGDDRCGSQLMASGEGAAAFSPERASSVRVACYGARTRKAGRWMSLPRAVKRRLSRGQQKLAITSGPHISPG
jgi:hypothetical protein